MAIAKTRPKSSGTGFIITEDGCFVTNKDVVGEGTQVRLLTESGIISAKVVKVDAANDLALLKAEGEFGALPVVLSRGVRLGATATTLGFPNIGLQGFAPKLAKGEIAGLAGAQDDPRHFQISTPIHPGNSGGALVDERGNVIGVVVAKLSQKAALATTGTLEENVNHAAKSSYHYSDTFHLRPTRRSISLIRVIEWHWAGDNRSAGDSRTDDHRRRRAGCAAAASRTASGRSFMPGSGPMRALAVANFQRATESPLGAGDLNRVGAPGVDSPTPAGTRSGAHPRCGGSMAGGEDCGGALEPVSTAALGGGRNEGATAPVAPVG